MHTSLVFSEAFKKQNPVFLDSRFLATRPAHSDIKGRSPDPISPGKTRWKGVWLRETTEDVGSVEPYMFEPLADSASTDELPSSADVDERSERLSDICISPSVKKRKLPTTVRSVSARCDCGC